VPHIFLRRRCLENGSRTTAPRSRKRTNCCAKKMQSCGVSLELQQCPHPITWALRPPRTSLFSLAPRQARTAAPPTTLPAPLMNLRPPRRLPPCPLHPLYPLYPLYPQRRAPSASNRGTHGRLHNPVAARVLTSKLLPPRPRTFPMAVRSDRQVAPYGICGLSIVSMCAPYGCCVARLFVLCVA